MAMVESSHDASFLNFAISLQKRHGIANDHVITIHAMW
jgi:hypothetical protein